MQSVISSASNPVINPDGSISVSLYTSTNLGYLNQCSQYQSWGIYSIPTANQIANIEQQADTNVVVTGYNNRITDTNFTATTQGSTSLYSLSWYLCDDAGSGKGIYAQPVNTANQENFMMGQSTNKVLLDIMNLLVEVITYLGTVETIFNAHVHSGVMTGSGTSAVSTTPWGTPPDPTTVNNDNTYITANKNLAITGTYTPHS